MIYLTSRVVKELNDIMYIEHFEQWLLTQILVDNVIKEGDYTPESHRDKLRYKSKLIIWYLQTENFFFLIVHLMIEGKGCVSFFKKITVYNTMISTLGHFPLVRQS